jgi:Selenoprotein, putative
MSAGLAAVANGFRGVARYLGGVMGADAYAKYLEHCQTAGPGTAPDGAGVLAGPHGPPGLQPAGPVLLNLPRGVIDWTGPRLRVRV